MPADPDKRALRDAAERWLPPKAARAPKASRLCPDLGVERLVGAPVIQRLAARLGLAPPRLDSARDRCAHATLCMLWPMFEGLEELADPCAASSE